MKRIARFGPYVGMLAVAAIVHGLLLFNDGIYWDDWLWILALKAKDWPRIRVAGFSRGAPLDAYFDWFFSMFRNTESAHRLVAFLSILLIAILTRALCRQAGRLSRVESWWVAVLAMVYPAFQTQILLATTNYVFYFMLFLGAALLAFHSEEIKGLGRVALRGAALLLFFMSFSLASLLALYFGFLTLFAVVSHRNSSLSWKETLTRFAPRHADYVVVPYLYWFVKKTWFPTYGLYASYNQFNFSPESLLRSLSLFVFNGIVSQFQVALVDFAHQPALWFLAALIAVGGWKYFSKEKPDRGMRPEYLLLWGGFLLALGMSAYVAVGLGPTVTGWSTRHSLLLGMPIALALVALARIITLMQPRALAFVNWALLALLLCAFGASTVSTYIDWQARWIKNLSMMAKLAHMRGAGRYSVYWVSDNYPLGGEREIQFYEYSSMFLQVWGDPSRIGFGAVDQLIPQLIEDKFSAGYNVEAFDPHGCQATLTIGPGRFAFPEPSLVAHYYYYKFFHPTSMPGFLAGVTDIKVKPYPYPLAADCRAP